MNGFRTKARAVDLLGENQIKDEATAISELLKNAHDADAEKAVMSIDTASDLLVLWDDGHGMTLDDVVEKWLVLGTDSKTRPEGAPVRRSPTGRVLMGEKGIGRLAIATLGDQMLMVTRREGSGQYVLVYIHWGIFTNSNLFLDETVVPVRTVKRAADVASVLPELKQELRQNILAGNRVRSQWTGSYLPLGKSILSDIDRFHVDHPLVREALSVIKSKKHGTVFCAAGLKEQRWNRFATAQPGERIHRKVRALQQLMSSFLNSSDLFEGQVPQAPLSDALSFKPLLVLDGRVIAAEETFTAEDQARYDYGLEGDIENGRFQGKAYIYKQDPISVDWDLMRNIDALEVRDCGPISLKMFFVEGNMERSKLSADDHAKISGKLEVIGGLYVYRDGLRVLPYGSPEFDFLGMEERRSKNLRALFSMRRMFGYIAISKENNPRLVDKASREGLKENAEYEHFRQVLINLLTQWARGFLEREGLREKYLAEAQQRHDRDRAAAEAMARWQQEHAAYLDRLRTAHTMGVRRLEQQAESVREEIQQRIPTKGEALLQVLRRSSGQELAYITLWELLQEYEDLYRTLSRRISGLSIDLPHDGRFSQDTEVTQFLTNAAARSSELRSEVQALLDSVWTPVHSLVEKKVQERLDDLSLTMGTRSFQVFLDRLTKTVMEASQAVGETERQLRSQLNRTLVRKAETYLIGVLKLRGEVEHERDVAVKKWEDHLSRILASLVRECQLLDERLAAFRKGQGSSLQEALAEIQERTDRLLRDLEDARDEAERMIRTAEGSLSFPILDLLSDRDGASAFREERRTLQLLMQQIREQQDLLEKYRGLAATGLAAEIVNHEFEQEYDLIRGFFDSPSARQAKRKLPELAHVEELFKHVEERHRMLSPLYRRTSMYRKNLSLREIGNKMEEFFASRIETYGIEFRNEIEPNFQLYESEGILYPVLINMINNAVFWLLGREERIITLRSDRKKGLLYVEDSGPGIPPDAAEWIFGLFNTTRPEGRGIGLYLVHELLVSRNHGVSCVLDQTEKDLTGACFRIEFDPEALKAGRGKS